MQLRRQLGISYNAAWRLKHKLMQVCGARQEPAAVGLGRTGRRVFGRREKRRQARRGGQDPVRGGGANHRRGVSGSRETDGGQGVSQNRDRIVGRSVFGRG